MSAQSPRLRLLFATMLILVGAASVWTDPQGAPEALQDQGDPATIAAAMAAFEAREADPDIQRLLSENRGAQPAGDTCGMRHSAVMPRQNRDILRRFALAALSDDPRAKEERLTALADHDDAAVRYRALIGLSRLHLQGGFEDRALAAIQRALALAPGQDPRCAADAWRLLAALQGTTADALQALETAVRQDPLFWDAHRERVLATAAILKTETDARRCAALVASLLASLGAIDALARDGDELRRIAMRHQPRNRQIAPSDALIVGALAGRFGRNDDARDLYGLALQSRQRTGCDGVIQDAIATRLDYVRGADETNNT